MNRIRLDVGQMLQLAGLVAAIVLAMIVNVLAGRHFTRWDWTKDRRWSLGPATAETVRTLEQPVDVWAIAGAGDPLEQSLREILVSYQALSSRIVVHWIDPDRDPGAFMDLQRRFGLSEDTTQDGRRAADAIVVVASGDKHWFLTPQDMFEQSDEVHVKPREERALTQAIRSVLAGEKAKLCFTVGHGELSLEDSRDERDALGSIRDLLDKNNYELTSVDTAAPNAHEPFAGCSVVVVAGPRAAFAPEEANRLRAWLMQGGSVLAAVGPIEASTPTGMTSAGLDDVFAPFGVALDDDLVHDIDPSVSIPETLGEGFFVTAHGHPVTASLGVGSTAHPPRVEMLLARSMRHVSPPGAASASDLLVTTARAFGKKSIVGAREWTDPPARQPGDLPGPLTLAMASERPKVAPNAPHGPRLVVVGSRFMLAENNWRQPRPLHGAAFVIDGALSWLSARPEVIDIPSRAEVAAGMHVSEEGLSEIRRYVLVLLPLAATALGLAVWAWRRALENEPYKRKAIRGGRST